MKQIYFIRHAKSEKDGKTDFDRDLSQKGKNDAKEAGKFLKKSKIKPDMIFASSAIRAAKTAKIIAGELNTKKLEFKEELYDITLDNFVNFIKKIDDKYKCVMIIAHNPTITEAAEYLSDSFITNLPTCGIFGVEFDINSFSDISEDSGETIMFDYPKMH